MPAAFRLVYDEDGYPRVLDGEAAWTRAIRSGSLAPETEVIVYAGGEAPRSCRARDIPDLADAFGIAAPPPPPIAPPIAPPAAPPPAAAWVPPPPAMPRTAPAPAPLPPPAPPTPPSAFVPAAAAGARHGNPGEAPLPPAAEPGVPRQGNKPLWIGLAIAGLLLLILFATTSRTPDRVPVAATDTGIFNATGLAPAPEQAAAEKPEERAPPSYATSFNCARASGEVETTICSDAALAAQDRALADLYRQRLRAASGLDASDLRASQAAWRETRLRCENLSTVRSCLGQLYADRLAALRIRPAAVPRPHDEADEPARLPPPITYQSPPPMSAARRAELRRGSISNEDYPRSALRAGASGTTLTQYTIGAEGRVVDCVVVQSSGNSALDSASCSIIRRRFRFDPALDDNGKPVEESRTQRIVWSLPDD